MVVDLETDAVAEAAAPESAKRTQILEGARRVFFARGFDAASMGEIAREAKVSKGTLYVYFDSKEALFAALIAESKRDTAEQLLELDPDAEDVRTALEDFARRMLRRVVRPEHVALVRVVIGASDKFPALARAFYEAGPNHGRHLISVYLEAQRERGRLVMDDPETAAWQFMGMCCHPVTAHVLLAGQVAPEAERVRRYAEASVAAFLAGYRAR